MIKRILFSVSVILLFLTCVVSCTSDQHGSSINLDHSFNDVVYYLSSQFGTNITEITGHAVELTGPNILDESEHYWVQTEQYKIDELLVLTAYYYQIGGESWRFQLVKKSADSCKLTVDKTIKLFLTFKGCRSAEERVLKEIKQGVEGQNTSKEDRERRERNGGRESGARASPPATTCLVLSGFIRRFTQISQIFCSARRMGGTSVCPSGRRFTPPPLNAERPTPDSERRSEKTPNSLPIN